MASVFTTNIKGPDAVAALNSLWDLATSQFSSYSTTSLAVGTGSKSLTIEAGKSLSVGQAIALYDTADVTQNMQGTVTSYNSTTGALVVNVTSVGGAGTYATWTVVSPGSSRLSVDIHGAATKATPADNDEFGYLDSGATFGLKKFTWRGLLSAIGAAFGATLNMGSGVSTGDVTVEVGGLRTGDGNAIIDLHGTTGTSYEARLIRAAGANGDLSLLQTGTGNLDLNHAGAGPLRVLLRGVVQFVFSSVASAVNYLQVAAAAAGSGPTLSAQGTDGTISIAYVTKGAGGHYLQTSGGTTQLLVAHTPSAVNYAQLTGAATGNAVALSAQGSDTNVPFNYQTKGAGAHNFYAAGALQFQITAVASAVNYLNFNGAVSGGAVTLSAQGGDTNIDLNLQSKGTGVVKANGNQVATLGQVGALSYRNKIRNGRMDIALRGTSLAQTANSASYTLDGWICSNSGTQVVTVSQQADTMAGSEMQYSLRVTVNTANAAIAAGNYALIEQPIEGYLVRDLIGNPIAIRFEVKSPKAGTHCVAIRNGGTADRSYILTYSVAAANTWQAVNLTLPAGLITAGSGWNWTNGSGVRVGFVLAAGSTFQTTAGAWQTGSFLATSAQVNCMDTVGNVFAVTGVQLEKGSASTAFEHRTIANELLFNQRYFVTGQSRWDGYATTGMTVSNSNPFKVTMRATPAVAFPSGVTGSGAVAGTTPATTNLDANGFWEYRTTTATGSGTFTSNWTASAELS